MTDYSLVSAPAADGDIEETFTWYENEKPGLGLEFLEELRRAYDRLRRNPLAYQLLRSGIRRALVRRFPHAVYFTVKPERIVILAVLHASRDPTAWQLRGT